MTDDYDFAIAQMNERAEAVGKPPAYAYEDFVALIDKYGIHHNAVVSWFRHDR